jgi:Tol biopolymer transport system component
VHECRGRRTRAFTGKPVSAFSPAWTPDGEHSTFLSRRTSYDKNTQVYAIPLAGGEAVQLSHAPRSISSYALSPDGKMLAFRMRDQEPDEVKINYGLLRRVHFALIRSLRTNIFNRPYGTMLVDEGTFSHQ